jgi:hypothetical protein
MDLNEPFNYAMSLTPIQILLMFTEKELSNCKLFERRELNRILEAYNGKTVKELIGIQLPDYRLQLYNHLLYLESADYLISQKDVSRLTSRQLVIMREYLFRFTCRSTVTVCEKLKNVIMLKIDDTNKLSFKDAKNLSKVISILVNDENFSTENVESFKNLDVIVEQVSGQLRPAEEISELFLKYRFVSENLLEAKAICVGLGLNPNTNWFKIQDYKIFAQYICTRFSDTTLNILNINFVLQTSKYMQVTNPCVICLENPINTIHIPCFHASLCQKCVTMTITNKCVVCRTDGYSKKIFIS